MLKQHLEDLVKEGHQKEYAEDAHWSRELIENYVCRAVWQAQLEALKFETDLDTPVRVQ